MSKTEPNPVNEARAIIQQEISDYRTKLEALTLLKEDATPNPILIEGETQAGYFCQLMADPRDVAKILLHYNYPMYRVLQEDAPDEMWNELAQLVGLESISSFDL